MGGLPGARTIRRGSEGCGLVSRWSVILLIVIVLAAAVFAWWLLSTICYWHGGC